MANIYLRTPFFVTITTASHLSAQMALTIDGTLRYTILKNATNTDQYIYTDGMVGPVAKQVQKEIIIHKGIERKERVRPTESVI